MIFQKTLGYLLYRLPSEWYISFHSSRNFLHTRVFFPEILRGGLYYLNSLLVTHIRNNDAPAVWDLFMYMHSTLPYLNFYTFTPVLSACSVLPDPCRGFQVHDLTIKTVVSKDVVTWNALTSSFLRHGLPKQAISIFMAMQNEALEFSEFTLCTVLKACSLLNAFRQGKQVHGLITIIGRDLLILGTALIDFYSDAGHIDEAITIFSCLEFRSDIAMQNAMVFGCFQNKKHEVGFDILRQMNPNMISLTAGLTACSETCDMWRGKQIHGISFRLNCMHDIQLSNALICMYGKCGKLSKSRLVFDKAPFKDIISWTSMIDSYARNGYGTEAIKLFEATEQDKSTIKPNSVTLLTVLSACRNLGLMEKGEKIFDYIREKHNMSLQSEHYACLVNILGKGGCIEEMWRLVDEAGKSDVNQMSSVWATVLNICQVNEDVARGEIASKCLLKLEPNNAGNYVLLSNFYAAVRRWELVDKFRSNLKTKGLLKDAGSSWVSVDGSYNFSQATCA